MEIAKEPIPQPVEKSVDLARDQIESFIAIHTSRRGKVLEFKHRDRKETTKVLVSRLPKEIQDDPEVVNLLME